jgi:hypothetical protein
MIQMDLMPIGMIIVLIVLLIEMRLASQWSPLYFNNGIKLYWKDVRISSPQINLDELSDNLNTTFKGTGFSSSILFNKIDDQTLGFREKIFEFSLFSYTPIMHGKIELNHTNIKVAGFVNWYPIAFFCLWYSFLFPTFMFDIDLIFLLAPTIIFAVIYIMQSRRYNKIVSQLTEIK